MSKIKPPNNIKNKLIISISHNLSIARIKIIRKKILYTPDNALIVQNILSLFIRFCVKVNLVFLVISVKNKLIIKEY